MAADAGKAVYVAVRDALRSALTVPVYDDVPPTTTSTFVTIDVGSAVDASTKDAGGQERTLEIHQWDSSRRDRLGVFDIQAKVFDALHESDLPVPGFVYCYWEYADSMLDNDGLTIHGVQRFRIRTNG